MKYKGDREYIEQVLNGRTNAFSFLVDRHKDRSFNLAFRICGNREEAEEIIQDSFLKAFRSLGTFKMKSSFATWLYRIVYNTAVSSVRSGRKIIVSLDENPGALNDFYERSETDHQADTDHRNKIVNFALQKLDEEDRGIIILYYYEELSVEEISGVTGLSVSAIKTRLFRSRQKMMEVIEKNEIIKTMNQ